MVIAKYQAKIEELNLEILQARQDVATRSGAAPEADKLDGDDVGEAFEQQQQQPRQDGHTHQRIDSMQVDGGSRDRDSTGLWL